MSVSQPLGLPVSGTSHSEQPTETVGSKITNVNEFKEHLKNITQSLDVFNALKDKVSVLKEGEGLNLSGVIIDRTKLRQMFSDLKKQILELHKYFGKEKSKRSKVKADGTEETTRKVGFNYPVYVSKYVVDFFVRNEATLGVDPITRQSISSQIRYLREKGLTTSGILTSLWTIYKERLKEIETVVNEKNGKPKQVSFFKADAHMTQCFGPAGSNTFERLTSREQKTNRRGALVPPFNPSRFHYTAWQSIYSDNTLGGAKSVLSLSKEQAEHLAAMKEWRSLRDKDESKLTTDEKVIIQCVNMGQFPQGNTDPAFQLKLRSYMQAKVDFDELDRETKVASAAKDAINPPKEKKQKKTA
jgi:hypothetical protein